MASALGNLGLVYRNMGEMAKAEEHHKRALEIDEKIGNPLGMANQLGNLGNIYLQRDEFDKAEDSYVEILEIFRKIGAWQQFVLATENLVIVRLRKSDFSGAIKAAGEGIAVAERLPHMANKLEKLKRLFVKAVKNIPENVDENESNQP